MSYFDSQLGQRPATQPPEDAQQAPRLFEAGLGACPREPVSGQASQTGSGGAEVSCQSNPVSSWQSVAGSSPRQPAANCRLPTDSCPLCRGALADEGGVYRCQGRCGARWLPGHTGALLDIAALPYGICGCCRPPQALAHAGDGAICPQSGQAYLLLPGGPALRVHAAPDGLCLCCAPPAPLVRQGTGLVCAAQPDQRYELRAGVPTPLAPPNDPAAALAAIDAALRRNSARVAVHGLFDVEF